MMMMIVDKWDQVLSDHKTGSLEIVGCSSHEDCLSSLDQRGNHHEELRDQMFDHLYRLEHRENHHRSDLSITKLGHWRLTMLFTMKIVFLDWSREGIIMESAEIKCFDYLYRLEHRENHHGSDLSIFTWIISGLILDTTPSEKPVD